MLLTERQLRRVIRKVLLAERKTIATVSDVQKFMPQLEEWSEILLAALAATIAPAFVLMLKLIFIPPF